jgi:hypothetical protein
MKELRKETFTVAQAGPEFIWKQMAIIKKFDIEDSVIKNAKEDFLA